MPFYLLNVYSIHNYAQIQSVIPESLRETPLRVGNAATVRLDAARQLREKKAAKKSGEVLDAEPVTLQGRGDRDSIPAPVFDRPRPAQRSRPSGKGKKKAVQSESHSDPQHAQTRTTIVPPASHSSDSHLRVSLHPSLAANHAGSSHTPFPNLVLPEL